MFERSIQSPSFDVVAEEDTLVQQIPGNTFHQFWEGLPFAEYFPSRLSERLYRTSSLELSPLAGDIATPVEVLINRSPVFVSAELVLPPQLKRYAGKSRI